MEQAVNVNFRLDAAVKKNMHYLEQKLEAYRAGKLRFAEHDLVEDYQ